VPAPQRACRTCDTRWIVNEVRGESLYLRAIRQSDLPSDATTPFEKVNAGCGQLVMRRARWKELRGKPGTRACTASRLAVVPDSAVSTARPRFWHLNRRRRPPQGYRAWYDTIIDERNSHLTKWMMQLRSYSD